MKAVILDPVIDSSIEGDAQDIHRSTLMLGNGETLLHRQIRLLHECGIKDFVITTGYNYEQVKKAEIQADFNDAKFTFVNSPEYDLTNYIYSLYNTREYLKDDVLLIYSDLVFNKGFVKKVLEDTHPSLIAVNKNEPVTNRDFKVRLDMEKVIEISDSLCGTGCFVCKPFYKFNAKTLSVLMDKVSSYVEHGETYIFPEFVFNEIFSQCIVKMISCSDDFVEQVRAPEDLVQVSAKIRRFDFREQQIISEQGGILNIKEIMDAMGASKPMIVCNKTYDELPVQHIFDFYGISVVRFQCGGSNAIFEDVVKGKELFMSEGCDCLISVGGESTINTAKCIKLSIPLDTINNNFENEFKYSPVKHISIPTEICLGTESTDFAEINCGNEKIRVSHDSILPEYVILDANLTRSQSFDKKKVLFFESMCHCIESMWSLNSDEESYYYAIIGLKKLISRMASYFNGSIPAAQHVMDAVNLAAKAFSITKTSLIHSMSCVIASEFGIDTGHAAMICLPAILQYIEMNVSQVKSDNAKTKNLIIRCKNSDAWLINVLNKLCSIFRVENVKQLSHLLSLLCNVAGYSVPQSFNNRIPDLIGKIDPNSLKGFPVDIDKKSLENIFNDIYSVSQTTEDLDAIYILSKMWGELPESYAQMLADIDVKKIKTTIKKKSLPRRTLRFTKKIIKKVISTWPWLKKKTYHLWRKNIFLYFQTKIGVEYRTVVFESFGGRGYNCNPKALYEQMLADEKYCDFKFIWAFNKPKKYRFLKKNANTKLVKRNSRAYIRAMATSKYWISNYGLPSYLVPGKEHVYIHTWHGKPLKKIGAIINGHKIAAKSKRQIVKQYRNNGKRVTKLLSPAPVFTNVMGQAFCVPEKLSESKIVETGYPRNDFLFKYTDQDVLRVKMSLGIPLDKKVALYTPTWRESNYVGDGKRYQITGYQYNSKIDFRKFANQLGNEYVILFRAHDHEAKSVDFSELHDVVIDVTKVMDINELYIISDIMISDYSGAIFDFANLRRPMILYAYDREEYEKIPGLNFNLDEIPATIVKKQEDLAAAIKHLSRNFVYDKKYRAFNKKYNALDGPKCASCTLKKLIDLKAKPTKSKQRRKKFRKYRNNIKAVTGGFFRTLGIYTSDNYKRLRSYKDKHKGERCFLIGNGPSLSLLDLEKIKDETCFACNLIYKIYDSTEWRAKYYCVTDIVFAKTVAKEIAENISVPIFTTDRTAKILSKAHPKIMTAVQHYTAEPYFVHKNFFAYYVPANATVMSFMIELAIYMGFSEIYLLGVDCSNGFVSGGHFTNDYENKDMLEIEKRRARRIVEGKHMTLEELGKWRQDRSMFAYMKLRKYADAHGVKIYNATRGGYLEEFERVDLDEVVSAKTQDLAQNDKTPMMMT